MARSSPRLISVGLVLALGLTSGFVLARSLDGPSASAQTADCNPTQVVPKTLLNKLATLNAKLDQAIEDYKAGDLGPRELDRRVIVLIELKYDAIERFPSVFGYTFRSLYDVLRALDGDLSRALRNDPDDRSQILFDLRAARQVKGSLEANLKNSPCGTE